MDKKFKLLENTGIEYEKKSIIYRIQALKDFGNVKKGDIGGWVEKEENLSHKGNCWIYNDAKVYGNAIVNDDAKILSNTHVFGNARVFGNAIVKSFALVTGSTQVYDSAKVFGGAIVTDNAKVFGNAIVTGNAEVFSNANVHGNCILNIERIGRDGDVSHCTRTMVVGKIGSRSDYTTFYKTSSGDIMVSCGCFNDTIDKFEKKVKETYSREELYFDQYMKAIDMVKKCLPH